MRNARLWHLELAALGFSALALVFVWFVTDHVAAQNRPSPQIDCPPSMTCTHPTFVSPAVPFDVPPKETKKPYNLGIYPPAGGLQVFTDGKRGHEWTVEVHCEDPKRVLLTDEAGERHCYAFWMLGASNPR